MPQIEQKANPKIEINTPMFGYITGQFTFGIMMNLLRDDIIGPDDYIEIEMDNGLKAAVRKKDITSIVEVE